MNSDQFTNVPLIWTPSEHDGRNVKKFQKIIEEKYRVKLGGYEDLHKWSIENLCEFYAELWDFLGILSSRRFDKVVDLNIPMRDSPKWFEGTKLNFAENLLKYRDDRLALIVDGHMSNRKEVLFATQAVISIGAIWTAALPMLGTQAVLGRFQQLSPKILLSEDGYRLGGTDVDMLPKLAEIIEGLPSLKKVLIVKSKPKCDSIDISGLKNSCFLDDFLKLGVENNGSIPPMEFEQVPFDHPITITYTSGSTGLPKGIIHGSSVLLALGNCMLINFDTDRDSRWLTIMPAATIMWIGYLSLHSLGQTLVLYEGAPFLLSPTSFWDLLEKQKVSHMIMFPDVFDEMERRNYFPRKEQDLSSLKFLVTAGTITKTKTYDFLLEVLKDTAYCTVYVLNETVTGTLGYRKLCGRWVPKMLTEIHKTNRMGTALEFLSPYHTDAEDILYKIVICDES
ncbi:acetoacetyl-CoA synthetase [Trichonephila clavata]|uniref:Acetoacetyl-CoA synthetase n=1 Tax=Trichonephila clavata TaxID=2740835 RepID=A0A8X6FY22_TRICU|nr:acetoacetyl-CoA synthetase [Trichonephila clavata]